MHHLKGAYCFGMLILFCMPFLMQLSSFIWAWDQHYKSPGQYEVQHCIQKHFGQWQSWKLIQQPFQNVLFIELFRFVWNLWNHRIRLVIIKSDLLQKYLPVFTTISWWLTSQLFCCQLEKWWHLKVQEMRFICKWWMWYENKFISTLVGNLVSHTSKHNLLQKVI